MRRTPRPAWHAAASILLLGATCSVGAGPASALSLSYDQTATTGGQIITSKVMVKDKMFRAESSLGGTRSIVIRNAQGTFSYMPDQRMAMQMPGAPEGQGPIESPEDYLGYLKERNATLLGSEMVNGVACDVYEFVDPSQGHTKAWVWTEKQFPLKFEVDGRQGHLLAELSHVMFDVPLADSLFELPSGVQVMNMGDMMKGLPAMPGGDNQ